MHGIIMGGWIETPIHEAVNHISVKRASGAHRIASYLREQGWDIEVLDFMPAWSIAELKEFYKQRIRKDTVFIGVSTVFSLLSKEQDIIEFMHWLKKTYPHVATIAGGKMLMTSHMLPADFHLAGYAEHAIVELLKKLTGSPSSVVIEKFEMMGKEYQFVNCDNSHPSYPMDDLQVKYENRDYIQPGENLTLELTRGCKFKCKFCYFNIIGYKGKTSRCMDNLYDELLRNYEYWGVTDYSCADETTNAEHTVLEAAGNVIDRLPFETNIQGYVRADLVAARPQDWEHMAKMGLWGHFYGIESFNHASAKSIGKGMNPEKLKEGILEAQDYFLKTLGKFRTTFSYIIGLPHETEETFDAGVKWMFDNIKHPSMNIYPLQIHHKITDSNLRNTYSEFEETWQESGLFRETTMEKLGASKEGLGENLEPRVRDLIWNRLSHPTFTMWEHDTMDIWEAHKIFAKYESNKDLWYDQFPHIWYFHTFQNAGMSYEDLHKSYREHGDITLGVSQSHKFVEEYKEKKLS